MTIKFTKSDQKLHERWNTMLHEGKHMSVGSTFFHLDTEESKKKFQDNLCKTEEERKIYKWYREEWYRRPKEFDPKVPNLCRLFVSW